MALPKSEQERAATSSFSNAKNASWQDFDRGHIYDYRESIFSEWETYAIWNKRILEDYSSAGTRGFPTQDTQDDGLLNCTSGIVYQRFENKLVSLLDDKRERDLDDNLSFKSGNTVRRNDNLVCAYLVSHKAQRHTITDQEAHISILNFIRSHNLNHANFIKDIFVVFVGRTSFLEEAWAIGIPSYEEPTQTAHYSSRGVATYDTYSDTGFHEFLRDSKYVNTTSEFDIDSSVKRSNQLYHVSAGTAIGFQARICSLAFDGVLLHETVTTWEFGTPANENGGSMEDLLLNYLSAFESCKLQNRTQGQIGLINEYNYTMNENYSRDIVVDKIQEMETTEDMFGNLFHQDNYCNYAIAQTLENFVSSEGSRVNLDPYTKAECFKY